MENKQIIVDNVNVGGCEFCEWKGSNIPQCRIRFASFESICEGYNCYYKQLAREKQSSQEARDTSIKESNRAKAKEQECEELKTLLNVKEQKLIKIKQYIEDNEWCILDEMYKDLEQIIESKEGDNL